MRFKEEWCEVPGTDGLYQVSSHGRLMRTSPQHHLVDGSVNGDGYVCCSLCLPGKRIAAKIHSLVALAFLGDRPVGHHVNHKSGNKQDNSLDNLEYLTLEGNIAHAKSIGIAGGALPGELNSKAKLSTDQVREIRSLYPDFTLKEIADEYGVTISNISCIIRRKTWRHLA